MLIRLFVGFELIKFRLLLSKGWVDSFNLKLNKMELKVDNAITYAPVDGTYRKRFCPICLPFDCVYGSGFIHQMIQ